MKKIRILQSIIGLLIAVLILDFATILILPQWHREIPPTDAVIILGAAINTPALYNRTLKGLELYEQGKAGIMVLSGGKISDSDISEAEYMERVIHSRAAERAEYVLEDQSHSTYDNITHSREKLPNTKSVIIVSDEFHLARAVIMAKRVGFEKVYWASPNPTYYSKPELRFYYVREFVAMLNYIPKFIKG